MGAWLLEDKSRSSQKQGSKAARQPVAGWQSGQDGGLPGHGHGLKTRRPADPQTPGLCLVVGAKKADPSGVEEAKGLATSGCECGVASWGHGMGLEWPWDWWVMK
jgi:hypothetical protein